MARTPIYAAGGIVVRGGGKRLLVAVVQRSKDERWVLPRGKLKRDEDPKTGARREVVEETGHRVQVHEFVGAITYRASGRPKLVQFWRMHAYERPSRDITKDILAVEWLPLKAAVRRLSYPLEKLFLQYAGRRALKRRRRAASAGKRKVQGKKPSKKPRKKQSKKQSKKQNKKRSEQATARKAKAAARRARRPPAPRGRKHAGKTSAPPRRAHARRLKAPLPAPVHTGARERRAKKLQRGRGRRAR